MHSKFKMHLFRLERLSSSFTRKFTMFELIQDKILFFDIEKIFLATCSTLKIMKTVITEDAK